MEAVLLITSYIKRSLIKVYVFQGIWLKPASTAAFLAYCKTLKYIVTYLIARNFYFAMINGEATFA
ncbi:MAG: hypothetical protein A2W80_16440 [Candidatus Riflebacteria bacterium GWC2_50_8]|nr:MAG: hypothetical protein A2W80_16440 [Candidatus Riflebacteria bacterium GWC2_50_8]